MYSLAKSPPLSPRDISPTRKPEDPQKCAPLQLQESLKLMGSHDIAWKPSALLTVETTKPPSHNSQQQAEERQEIEHANNLLQEENEKLLQIVSSAAEQAQVERQQYQRQIEKLQLENQKLQQTHGEQLEKVRQDMTAQYNAHEKSLKDQQTERLEELEHKFHEELERQRNVWQLQDSKRLDQIQSLETELQESKAEHIQQQLRSHSQTAELIQVKVHLQKAQDEIGDFANSKMSADHVRQHHNLIHNVLEDVITTLQVRLTGYNPDYIDQYEGSFSKATKSTCQTVGIPLRQASRISFRGKLGDSEYFDASKKPWLTSARYSYRPGRSRPDTTLTAPLRRASDSTASTRTYQRNSSRTSMVSSSSFASSTTTRSDDDSSMGSSCCTTGRHWMADLNSL